MLDKNNWGKLSFILLGLVIGAGISAYFLIISGYFSLGWISRPTGSSISTKPQINRPVPDFEFQSLSGKQVHLNELNGKPVLVNFWATWCEPCKLEMPIFQAYATKYSDEIIVLPINADDDLPDIQRYIDEFGLTIPVYVDPGGKVEKLFRVLGLPTTYFIDQDGILRIQHVGIMTEKELQSYLLKVGVGIQ